MILVYIGVGMTGLIMAIHASQMIPTLLRYRRKPAYGNRTSPRVVTKIQVSKEKQYEP